MGPTTFDTEKDGPQQPPALKIPPVRTFIVRRIAVTAFAEEPLVEEIIVHAHEMQFPSATSVCFVKYRLINGEVYPQIPRVFSHYEDVEEIVVEPSMLLH